jgi:hypothetical protein
MGVKVIRIYQLDGIVNARLELVGGFFEVEVPAGPVAGGYMNKKLTTEQLAEVLGGAGSPNHSNSLLKSYRYLTRKEIAANGNYGEAFEDLVYATACIGTHITVEKYQPNPAVPMVINQVLVAVYDRTVANDKSRWVHVDGSFRPNDKTPAKFVPIDSDEARYGYVRRDTDPASITDWHVGELSIWSLNGTDQFATSKKAGGIFPAFTGVENDYWEPAATPQPPASNSFAGLTGSPYSNAALADVLIDLYNQTQGATYNRGRMLYVQDAGQFQSGIKGSLDRPFKTLSEAHIYATDGDTIMVLPGGAGVDSLGRSCYNTYTNITKNITVVNMPGVIYAAFTDIGKFAGSQPYRVTWHGGIFLSNFNVIKQYGGESYFVGHDMRIEGTGKIQAFGSGVSGKYRDKIELYRAISRSAAGATESLLITGRSDESQAQVVYLMDCDLQAKDGPVLRWLGTDKHFSDEFSQFVLRGSTRLFREDGGQVLAIMPTVPYSEQYTEAEVLVDERAKGGGGGNTGPVLPLRDVYPSEGKRNQVIQLFTTDAQVVAADIAIAGDTTNYFFSSFYDFTTNTEYKAYPNPARPDAQGKATVWWMRTQPTGL